MGFTGSEAFRGAAAPSLKTEVSGETMAVHSTLLPKNVWTTHQIIDYLFTHITFLYSNNNCKKVSSNSNRALLDSQELNAASTVRVFTSQWWCTINWRFYTQHTNQRYQLILFSFLYYFVHDRLLIYVAERHMHVLPSWRDLMSIPEIWLQRGTM